MGQCCQLNVQNRNQASGSTSESQSVSNDDEHFHSKNPDKDIKIQLDNKGMLDQRTHKILLLGAGSSGKSTILKQMRYLFVFHRGYPEDQKERYKQTVYENIIQILTTLCKKSRDYGYTNEIENFEYIELLISYDLRNTMLDFTSTELKSHLISIWSDNGIKKAWERRDEYLIMDNAHYFLSCMKRILSDDYIPSFPDVVYTRSRSTGIIQETFEFSTKSNKSKERYEIVDVGGQRTERKKWVQCFDDVVAVLFVIALSSYDQNLWEDNNTNRLTEAFDLVNDVIHTKALKAAQFIVFLNKRDLFQIKIGRVPFKPDGYNGDPHDPQQAMDWMKVKIRAMAPEKQFYFQVTCATDTEDVNRVFVVCHDIIIRRVLKKSGLLY